MPVENLRYTITGANPQTGTLQITVDDNGNGNAGINYAGPTPGVDQITAFLDSASLTSNTVQAVWQGTNGPISVSPIQAYLATGDGSGIFPAGLSSGSFAPPVTVNSLMMNTHPSSLLSGYNHDSANQNNPPLIQNITNSGAYAGTDITLGNGGSSCNYSFVGFFVVAAPGNITFTAYVNSAFLIAIPGAVYQSGPQFFGLSSSPIKGYPPVLGFNAGRTWPGGNYAVEPMVLNFPSAGVYSFEIMVTTGADTEKEFCLLANSAVIPPVSATTVPPPPAAGTGILTVSPVSTGPVVVNGTANIQFFLSGLKISSRPYLGLLENVSGRIYIYNDPNGGNTFGLPSGYDFTTAATSVFSLAGSNASWQGRLSVAFDGAGMVLEYNGGGFDYNVPSTQLTLTQEDVAFYNPTNKTYDTYPVTAQGGGQQISLEVDYLIFASVASISPTSIPADGNTHIVTVNLFKPLHPFQNGSVASVPTASGFQTLASTAVFNSAGFLIAFNVELLATNSVTNINTNMAITISGTYSFLSGTQFVTQTFFFPVQNQPLVLTAVAGSDPRYLAQSGVTFATGDLNTGATFNFAIIATTSTFQSATIFYSNQSTPRTNIGTVAPRLITTNGANQWVATYTFTYDAAFAITVGSYFVGFTETNTDGQSVTFTGPNLVSAGAPASGIGTGTGGNPGCPALCMFTAEKLQVADLTLNDSVDCLEKDWNTTNPYQIESISHGEGECIRLVTENGAEVIVSENTPVPTVEAVAQLALGNFDVPTLASDIVDGLHLYTDVGNGLEHSKVILVQTMGIMPIARVVVGQRNFAAGAKADKRIFTHNLQPKQVK